MYADGQWLSHSHAAYSHVQVAVGAVAAQKIKLSHEAKASVSTSCAVKGSITVEFFSRKLLPSRL
jgi:hypothetical protein